MRASGGRAHTYHDHPYGGNGNSGGGGGAPVGGGAGMYEHQQQQRFQQPPPLAPQFRAPPRQQQPQQYPQVSNVKGALFFLRSIPFFLSCTVKTFDSVSGVMC